ncbi:class I adenylate-forming enzyme family protein [uncultured Mycobacterium sp.]|uniref:class I adenylate-forming enzyme family protein n=1 Tax=uncultured Mycobacterium sp. TaxID=171292 RepID=UPI0035CA1FD8
MRLWQAIEVAVKRFSGRRFVFDTYGRTLTFIEFRERAISAAAGLRELGIGRDSRVSWQLPSGLEAAVLMVALSRLGAIQNPVIMSLREAELRTVSSTFDPEFVFVPGRFRGCDHRALAESVFPAATVVTVDANGPEGAAQAGIALPAADPVELSLIPDSDGTRWVYLTSGTSKEPKGVKHTDKSLWFSPESMMAAVPLQADDVFPIAFPFAHIGGVVWLIAALRIGLALQMIDVFDPARSPLEMAGAGATILGSATPFFEAYLDAQRRHGSARLFSRLRFCLAGGAPVAADLDERVRTELGGEGVLNGYGLTECPLLGFPPMPDRHGMRSRSSWLPGPGAAIRIVDPGGADLRAGQEGELLVRAPQMFSGYLDPSLDTDALDDQGFLHTGDLAILGTHGEVTITGRLKEVVVRKGENISMLEVEDVLIRHPDIADVAVIGLPDRLSGERCCAALVVRDQAPVPSRGELRTFCRSQGLAAFKSPEEVVVVSQIPRNAMGKIQRNTLRELVLGEAKQSKSAT